MVNIDKIKKRAKEKGISVAFICERVGKTRTFLNDVRNRGGDISAQNLDIIAEILDVNVEYLRDETEVVTSYKSESPSEMSKRDSLALKAFRSLTVEEQEFFLSLMRSRVEKQRDDK